MGAAGRGQIRVQGGRTEEEVQIAQGVLMDAFWIARQEEAAKVPQQQARTSVGQQQPPDRKNAGGDSGQEGEEKE